MSIPLVKQALKHEVRDCEWVWAELLHLYTIKFADTVLHSEQSGTSDVP